MSNHLRRTCNVFPSYCNRACEVWFCLLASCSLLMQYRCVLTTARTPSLSSQLDAVAPLCACADMFSFPFVPSMTLCSCILNLSRSLLYVCLRRHDARDGCPYDMPVCTALRVYRVWDKSVRWNTTKDDSVAATIWYACDKCHEFVKASHATGFRCSVQSVARIYFNTLPPASVLSCLIASPTIGCRSATRSGTLPLDCTARENKALRIDVNLITTSSSTAENIPLLDRTGPVVCLSRRLRRRIRFFHDSVSTSSPPTLDLLLTGLTAALPLLTVHPTLSWAAFPVFCLMRARSVHFHSDSLSFIVSAMAGMCATRMMTSLPMVAESLSDVPEANRLIHLPDRSWIERNVHVVWETQETKTVSTCT